MPYSHHSHSGSFCRHAKGTLEEVVLEAIDQGFKVFGLSEHAPRYRQEDLYPEESDLTPTSLKSAFLAYLTEAHRLRILYASQITLLVGLESDYITSLDLDGLDTLLEQERERIDYVVGSLHHVAEVPIDFDRETFDKALEVCGAHGQEAQEEEKAESEGKDRTTMTQLLHTYFDNQLILLQRIQPEVIGHFDLIRLWNPKLDFRSYDGAWEKVERNVRYGVGYGALFEVNAASFRKGWEEGYPAWDVLELIISLDGRLCLSDDSHGPLAVGLNYHRLHNYLRSHNVDELWYLSLFPSSEGSIPSEEAETISSKSSVQPKEGRGSKRSGRVTPKKVEGNWWEDEFWMNRQIEGA